MHMKHIYKFSIVMAIYNVEKYLEEAILSVINQSIGFEKSVQLILVNDGSKDGSHYICEKYKQLYPDNIVYITKENGGVSSARNEGMKYIKGKYMNFLDADDKLEINALEIVYDFFETVYENVDIVSIPIKFFEGKIEEHILNYKYSKQRVIDLDKEYTMIQLSSSSSFIKSSLKESFKFNENMKYAEDADLVNKILLEKNTLGVVNECYYLYRFRSEMSSATQTGNNKKEWYLDYIKKFSLNIIDYCIEKNKKVPKFIQFAIIYDLQWRINSIRNIENVLNKQERKEFFNIFNFVIKNIKLSILLKQKSLRCHRKFIIAILKYSRFTHINDMLVRLLIKC